MSTVSFLPAPPSDREKFLYARPDSIPFFLSGAIGLSAFVWCSVWFVIKSPWLTPYVLFCACYFANIGFCTIGSLFARPFDLPAHNRVKFRNLDYQPSVDVFLPNCGEPIALLSNTFKAVHALDYENLRVWVLDDAGRDDVKILAELHGFEYISRPNKGEMKKSGNMRYAFARTTGDLILVFDADFAPRSDFLREAVPYFAEDEKIAIVQTPQYFRSHRGQTAIERGATFLQEVFHRLVQNFRNTWGASVCTGSCAVYRRSALEPVGGAYPVHRSEDVHTGLYVLREGWKIRYLPLVLSCGLSPDSVEGFFNQHYRWCAGSIKLITSKLFWQQSNLGLAGKFSYLLSILYYITSGTGIFCFSLPTLINVWFMPWDFTIANYSLIFPAIVTVTLVRGFWAKNPWGTAPLVTAFAASYTHLCALIDVVTGDIAPWVPTGAVAGSRSITRFDRFKRLVAIIPPLQFALLVMGLGLRGIDWIHAAPISAWMGVQLVLQALTVRHIMQDSRQG